MQRDASDEYMKKMLEIEERHFRKYGSHRMTLDELDALCWKS